MSNYALTNSLINLAKKYLIKERVSDGNKKLDTIITILFFLGMFLLVCQIGYLRVTIINSEVPLLILFVPGLILTPFLYNTMNNIDGLKAHWILHYVAHTFMTGGILLFLFMATNYYFAENTIQEKRIEVLRTESSSGPKYHREQRIPNVIINYEGIEENLSFSNPEMEKVMKAKFVRLFVKKGFFGFDIIEKYEVE